MSRVRAALARPRKRWWKGKGKEGWGAGELVLVAPALGKRSFLNSNVALRAVNILSKGSVFSTDPKSLAAQSTIKKCTD